MNSNVWLKYYKKVKKTLAYSTPGFTLIELSIVMIVVGLITGAVFKAQDLIEAAQIRSTISEIQRIYMAIQEYKDRCDGFLPGNDPRAAARFGGGVANGSGNGLVEGQEIQQVWAHLARAVSFSPDYAPASKIGGVFSIRSHRVDGQVANYMVISAGQGADLIGALTPKQAFSLSQKMGENQVNTGRVFVQNGANGNTCMQNNQLNLGSTHNHCVVLIKLS